MARASKRRPRAPRETSREGQPGRERRERHVVSFRGRFEAKHRTLHWGHVCFERSVQKQKFCKRKAARDFAETNLNRCSRGDAAGIQQACGLWFAINLLLIASDGAKACFLFLCEITVEISWNMFPSVESLKTDRPVGE